MAETPPKSQPKKAGPAARNAPPAKKVVAAPTAPAPEVKNENKENMVAQPVVEPVPVASAVPPSEPPATIVEPAPVAEPVKEEVAAPPVTETAEPAASMMEAAPEAAAEPEEKKPEASVSPIPADAEEGTTIMTDAIETTKKVAAEAKEKFQAMFGEFNEKAKAAVEKSSKMLEDMNELTKGNVEALVESGKIAAKGAEALGQEAAEYSRKSFEKASSTMKSFASVKSPTEFFQLQSEFFSSAFDAMASEASKSSEALLKLAGDVAQPISTRISVVSDKVKSFTA